MKPSVSKSIIKDLKDRGYIEHNGIMYPPAQAAALNIQTPVKPKHKRGPTKIFSDAVDTFTMLITQNLQITIRKEYRFNLERKWRFDYAIPDHMIAIEVEGGAFTGGRHTRGAGFVADMEKYNSAASLGWTLIRRTPDQLLTEKTIQLIQAVIDQKNNF